VIRLGIVAALPGEGRCLAGRPIKLNHVHELSDGTLLGLSGVGPKQARIAAEGLLGRGCTALLSWGCAGGLSPQAQPGHLLLPSKVLTPEGSEYGVDSMWHDRLMRSLSAHFLTLDGALAATGMMLTTSLEKQILYKKTGAVAVDMESAAIAALAAEAGLPFAVIRAVADNAVSGIPACVGNSMDHRGHVLMSRLMACLALRPWQWPGLLRLGRRFHLAQATLKGVAHRLGPGLLAASPAEPERLNAAGD
jgi:adenosylhomocysteine nucleosidase